MGDFQRKLLLSIFGLFCLILVAAAPAAALLPAVQGQIILDVDRATPGAFGVDIAPGTIFTAAVGAVSADGSVFPSDGLARVRVTDFFLQIGDTFWDETMTPPGVPLFFEFLFGDGSVKGLAGEITPYNPAHADLIFRLPASPGVWEAIDRIVTIDPQSGREIIQDRGVVAGTYTPDVIVVPIPSVFGLFGSGLLIMAGRRISSGW